MAKNVIPPQLKPFCSTKRFPRGFIKYAQPERILAACYHRHSHYIREKRFQHDVRHGFIFNQFKWISVQDEDGSEYMELFYFDLTPMRQMILTRRTQRKITTERECNVRTIQRSWKEHRKTQCH